MMMAGKFQIGDVVPMLPRSSIVEAGAARWFALRVDPQREDQVEAWLRQRGVYAFHPVKMRQTVRFGKVREYARRYLPGYVFARFPGEPVVHQVMRAPFIIGALTCSKGHWGVLEPKRLQAIHAMRQLDEAQRKDRAAALARRIAGARIRAGESAMFQAGPFADFPCEVVELLSDGGAIVRLMIFGRETRATAKAGELVRAQRDPLTETNHYD